MPLPRGGQLRTGIEQALDDHGHNQIALRTTLGGNHRIQAEFANGQQHGFDVAVGQSLLRGEQILGRNQGLIAQQAAEGVDFLLGPIGEVGQGTFVDFVALAVALAEEDGGRGVAIGDGLDVHGITICIYIRLCQYQPINYMGTFDKTYLGNTGMQIRWMRGNSVKFLRELRPKGLTSSQKPKPPHWAAWLRGLNSSSCQAGGATTYEDVGIILNRAPQERNNAKILEFRISFYALCFSNLVGLLRRQVLEFLGPATWPINNQPFDPVAFSQPKSHRQLRLRQVTRSTLHHPRLLDSA